MSTERERAFEKRLKAEGYRPSLVGIDRDDDLAWAKFRVGTGYKTIVGSGESDEDAAADIIRQAKDRAIARVA
jgi:hypothetical protein